MSKYDDLKERQEENLRKFERNPEFSAQRKALVKIVGELKKENATELARYSDVATYTLKNETFRVETIEKFISFFKLKHLILKRVIIKDHEIVLLENNPVDPAKK